MNKIRVLLCSGVLGLMFTGCASVQAPVNGLIYTDVSAPVTATGNSGASKKGTAQATSILGAFAFGDASIKEAARKGGITKIQHVDYKATSFLFIYANYEVTVYGE